MLVVLNSPEHTFDVGRDLLAEAKRIKNELSIAKAYLLQHFLVFSWVFTASHLNM